MGIVTMKMVKRAMPWDCFWGGTKPVASFAIGVCVRGVLEGMNRFVLELVVLHKKC